MINKKICILTSAHTALDVRIFYKEAKSLAAAGYDVSIIGRHGRNEKAGGIRVIALPKPRNHIFRFFSIFKILKLALNENACIYHFHDPELIVVAILLKLLSGAKVIYDVHEDMPKAILSREWMVKCFRKPASGIFNRIEKNLSGYFDYIVAATPSIADTFRQKKVVVVRNYPVAEQFLQAARSASNIKRKGFYLIYCGDLSKSRGIKEIVLSLGLVRPSYMVRLKLFGDFENLKFKKEITSLKEWSKVEHSAWVLQEKVIKNLMSADCGLCCHWAEPNEVNALPVKIFEYMAAGLPIIASNFSLLRKIIEGNNCGICVDPHSPEEIAKAITYLLAHPKKMIEMGMNGKKAVSEKYSWQNENKKLLKVYEELTACMG